MSEAIVFKKKVRRNFRRKNIHDDKQEEGEVEQATELNNTGKQEKKPVKSAANTLLSFDHGEEDEEVGEAFKVKKSKESRKLSKQRLKAKKTKGDKPDEESSPPESEGTEQKILENLREELSNLGGDDVEQEKSDIDEEVHTVEFRTLLNDGIKSQGLDGKSRSFHIPDAAAIHAARKTREMARQLGGEPGDYVPLDDTTRYSGRFETSEKSRLVREDDNDNSDEERDGPLGFGTRKLNTHPALQRRLEVEQALATESDGEENSAEEDDALRRFEEEQIRKGVSIPQAQQEEDSVYNMYIQQQLQENEAEVPVPGFHQPKYPPVSLNTVTMDMVWEKMNNRIVSLQEVHRSRRLEKEKISSQLETCDTSIVSLGIQMGDAERRFGFFQEMRGYVRDLIECLNE